MLHASQNRYGSITAKAGRELVCLVALGQQPWLSPVSVPKFSPKKAIPCINAASIRQVAHSNTRLLCFAISDVHVILLGPIPSSG